jgi:S-layer homology domain
LLASCTIGWSLLLFEQPAIASPAQLAQAQLNDISSNWAAPFIEVLAAQGIVAGYPDGSFQPDQSVTRAEFAALLNKAFSLTASRPDVNFTDVSANFWGKDAVSAAYRSGFMAGYPNNIFAPNRSINRIESLVALTNGTQKNVQPGTANLAEIFADASQVPGFGQNPLLIATQKCITVSLFYPESRLFNPNGAATRADVAAFLHQTLVATGRLPKLADGNSASRYIVNCGNVAQVSEEELFNATGVGVVPPFTAIELPQPNAPVGGIVTPSAFGANWGDVFAGVGYSRTTNARSVTTTETEYGVGLGLGDAQRAVGLEASYSIGGGRRVLNRSGLHVKLHKIVANNFSIAAGVDNLARTADEAFDGGATIYGVATGVLPIGSTSNITASIGVGNGRFKAVQQFNNNIEAVNVFGSLGLRFSENIALATDYDGRGINIGLPLTIKLSNNVGVQVTPSLINISGADRSSSGFGISGGVGVRF